MAAGDLTTLASLKAFMPGLDPAQAGGDTTYDDLLGRLITAVSDQFKAEAGTSPTQTTYTEARNGHGQAGMTLLNFPVISVTSVKVDGTTIPARPSVSESGWVLSSGGRVELVGYRFTEGIANVEFVYSAGYATVPFDIEQAIIKMVALQFSDRKRIGVASTSQAGMSTSFGDAPVLAYWRSVVDSYRVQAV
jgi:hypothetical protein